MIHVGNVTRNPSRTARIGGVPENRTLLTVLARNSTGPAGTPLVTNPWLGLAVMT